MRTPRLSENLEFTLYQVANAVRCYFAADEGDLYSRRLKVKEHFKQILDILLLDDELLEYLGENPFKGPFLQKQVK